MQIIEVNTVTDELIESMARLIPQLTQKPLPTKDTLAEMLAAPSTTLITACENGRTIGMLTLVLYRTPTAQRARIDDVITDESSRGKGVGEAMIRYAIEIALKKKAVYVDLTSRPERKAANRLYERIGFKKYHTNVYHYPLG